MPDETHKLQKDPPEGSRKIVEHELERQSGERAHGAEKRQDEAAPGGKSDKAGERRS